MLKMISAIIVLFFTAITVATAESCITSMRITNATSSEMVDVRISNGQGMQRLVSNNLGVGESVSVSGLPNSPPCFPSASDSKNNTLTVVVAGNTAGKEGLCLVNMSGGSQVNVSLGNSIYNQPPAECMLND